MFLKYRYINYICMYLLTIGTVFAQETPNIEQPQTTEEAQEIPVQNSIIKYYTAEYECNGYTYISNWQITNQYNSLVANIAVKKIGEKDATLLKFSGPLTGDANVTLVNENNDSKLQIPVLAEESLKGAWLENDGRLKDTCSDFALSPKDEPLTLYQDIIDRLKKTKPTLKNAQELAKMQFSLPPLSFISPDENTIIGESYSRANADFWTKFYQDETILIKNLPTNTEKEVDDLLKEGQNATSLSLSPNGIISKNSQDMSQKFAHTIVVLINDRINALNRPVAPLGNFSPQTICNRYALIGDDTLESWELISGLATDYWGRFLQQNVAFNQQKLILELTSCSNPDAIKSLQKIWPQIEKRADNGQYLLEHIKIIQNTPENIEAYKNSNYLQLNQDEIKKREISPKIIERLVGDKIAVKAAQMQKSLQENLGASFVADNNLDDFSADKINDHCQNLLGSKIEDQSPLKALYQQCQIIGQQQAKNLLNNKITKIIDSVTQAQNQDPVTLLSGNQWLDINLIAAPLEIDDNYLPKQQKALAKLQTDIVNKAEKNIHDNFAKINLANPYPAVLKKCEIIANTDIAAISPLKNMCLSEIKTYDDMHKKYQCDKAIEQAHLTPIMLDTDIYFDFNDANQKIKLRQLICRMALHDIQTKITQSGKLFWSESYIEFISLIAKDNENNMKAYLTPMKNGLRLVDMVGSNTIDWLKTLNILEY